MSAPIEQIAVWILEAIEAEETRQSDITLRRGDDRVLGEVMSAHKFKGADIDRGRRFLADLGCISATWGSGGETTFLRPAGLQYLAAHRSKAAQAVTAERDKKAWTLDRRLAVWAIVVAIIGVAVYLVSQ